MKQQQESLQSLLARTIRIAGIVDDSVVDGPGVRYTIFTQGCSHNCTGCHNPATHDYNGGYEASFEDILNDLKSYKYIKAVTFSGGEPFDQPQAVAELSQELKERGYHILIYSGYTFEEIIKDEAKLKGLNYSDMLVDGRFNSDKRSLALPFRGSTNQRLLDVKESLERGAPVENEKWKQF